MGQDQAQQQQAQTPADNPFQGSPVVHRICEACNCMFTVRAADPNHRCNLCKK